MEAWLSFALLGAFFTGAWYLVARKLLLKEANYLQLAVVSNWLAALATLPLAFFSLQTGGGAPDLSTFPLLVLVASGIVWTLITIVNARSIQLTEVSVRVPFTKTYLFWVLLFTGGLLMESISISKMVGVALIFAGTLAIYS